MNVDEKIVAIEERHDVLKDKHVELSYRVTHLEEKTRLQDSSNNVILKKLDELSADVQQMHIDRLIEIDREKRNKLQTAALSTAVQIIANIAAVLAVLKALNLI